MQKRNCRTAEIPQEQPGNDIMNLIDLPAESGVPLGGIGTGCFSFAPNGYFVKINLNNTERDFLPGKKEGFFLAIWDGASKTARRLQRDKEERFSMKGYEKSSYTGLFPTARLSLFDEESVKTDLNPTVRTYSPLIPQNVQDSALPVAWIEVDVRNESDIKREASVAFSWEDLIARGIKDPGNLDDIDPANLNGWSWDMVKQVDTKVRHVEMSGYEGIRQLTLEPLSHNKDTYQNYNTDVVLLADQKTYDENGITAGKVDINCVMSYDLVKDQSVWESFCLTGQFAEGLEEGDLPLSKKNERASASIVCARINLPPNCMRTIRFMVAWYAPEYKKKTGHASASYKTADYNKYYHNRFKNIGEIVSYCAAERERLYLGTLEWHQPILKSNMPDWLKFKMINSGYVLYTNSILNKAGTFTCMEGGMIGMTGTSDQRLSSHPIYQKLFTQLDRAENTAFGMSRDHDDKIMHFTGNYYHGIEDSTAARRESAPQNGWMIDNSMSWVIQIAKDYQNTCEAGLIQGWKPAISGIFNWLKTRIFENDGILLQIPQGPTTYDDREHPAVMSYSGSVYLTTLQAIRVIALADGDVKLAKECDKQSLLTKQSMNGKEMWNGRYYAYGFGTEGAKPPCRVDLVFSGMLAGQFLSRYAGWEDILPFDKVLSSVQTQITTSVLNAPGYYMPKVWDPVNNLNLDTPGSSCWPFYMESYSAMLAIQSGYTADAFKMIEQFQLIHLKRGLNWSVKLWEPGAVTYMTAPVTWFITDVLSGTQFDLPNKTMTVGPVVVPGTDELIVPLYYPGFWAEFNYNKIKSEASLKITKKFTDESIMIDKVRVHPNGRPSSQAEIFNIDPFQVEEGNILTFASVIVEKMNDIIERNEYLSAIPPKPYKNQKQILKGNGEGLTAEYSNNRNFTPIVKRTDNCICFNAGERLNIPDVINPSDFCVRWTGKIEMTHGGIPLNKFLVRTNGGICLRIDNQIVINKMENDVLDVFESDFGLDMSVGVRYNISLQVVYHDKEIPICELNWMITPQNYGVIPRERLYQC